MKKITNNIVKKIIVALICSMIAIMSAHADENKTGSTANGSSTTTAADAAKEKENRHAQRFMCMTLFTCVWGS